VTLTQHGLTCEAFAALAEGGGGTDAVRCLVAAERSRVLLLIRAVVDAATAAGREQATAASRGLELLADVQRRAPHAAEAVLRHPAVAAWAVGTAMRLLRGERTGMARPGALAAVAAAAAIRGGVPCEIEIPWPDGPPVAFHPTLPSVMLPSIGRARLPAAQRGAVARLAFTGEGIELACGRTARPYAGADAGANEVVPGWTPIRTLRAAAGPASFEVLFDDLDPCRFPGDIALRDRVPDAEFELWRHRLADGWQVLARDHPQTAVEVAAVVTALTPLVAPACGQTSATSRHAFGCVALSLPSDGQTMALALAHEVQHAKLAALMDMLPLMAPSSRDRFYAPWRDDPRPLSGLLHGTYAHIAVAGFWCRQRHVAADPAAALEAHAEFARWRDAAAQVATFLTGRPELNVQGRRFVAGMSRTLRRWRAEQVPATALASARKAASAHHDRWMRDNG
jgi:HEXXH motif-containing protein